jgi:RNA polymerase sigma factor (TIGR02999 family)
MTDVTRILSKIESGDLSVAEQLLPLVYEELRKLAGAKLAHEKPGQTLQATALVHEAFLRLRPQSERDGWKSKAQFFSAAAEAMRRILVEQARRKRRLKRGGDFARVDLISVEPAILPTGDDIEALDEALERLTLIHPDKAEVVKLRYFAGLTVPQIAETLNVSVATVERRWAYARAWLFREISD